MMRWWEERKHLLVREKERIDEAFPKNEFSFEVRGEELWITGTILDFFEYECKCGRKFERTMKMFDQKLRELRET